MRDRQGNFSRSLGPPVKIDVAVSHASKDRFSFDRWITLLLDWANRSRCKISSLKYDTTDLGPGKAVNHRHHAAGYSAVRKYDMSLHDYSGTAGGPGVAAMMPAGMQRKIACARMVRTIRRQGGVPPASRASAAAAWKSKPEVAGPTNGDPMAGGRFEASRSCRGYRGSGEAWPRRWPAARGRVFAISNNLHGVP